MVSLRFVNYTSQPSRLKEQAVDFIALDVYNQQSVTLYL